MNQERIMEIRARCEAATPGEWHSLDDWLVYTGGYIEGAGISNEQMVCTTKEGNAEFIAHARQDIPELLECIEQLQAELAEYKQAEKEGRLHIVPCKPEAVLEAMEITQDIASSVCPNMYYSGNKLLANGEADCFMCRYYDEYYGRDDEVIMITPYTNRELVEALKKHCQRCFEEDSETCIGREWRED